MRRTAHRSGGFTLVELLVVVGIVALLLAVLLPALAAARASAKGVKCLAQQREVAAAVLARAADHDGYLPLGGLVDAGPVTGLTDGLAPLLGDARRKRYAYTPSSSSVIPPTGELPAPFQVAVTEHLDPNAIPSPSVAPHIFAVADHYRDHAAMGLFVCPDANEGEANLASVALAFGGDGTRITVVPLPFDYALNEGVTGFDAADGGRLRRRGRLVSLRDAARTALLGDGRRELFGTRLASWSPPDPPPGATTVTLADALRTPGSRCMSLDPDRHRRRLNIAFIDGHAAAAAANVDALDDVLLAGP